MATRVLLTGFEAFGGHAVNPSERVLRPLAAAAPGGVVVSTRVLRVSYRDGFAPLRDALSHERFDAALLLGLGAGRAAISFERVAVNRRGPATDNDGVHMPEERIEDGGPAACFSTLPIDALVAAVHATGVPAEVSDDAGTFLCNQVLYQALRHADRSGIPTRIGFVHLPYFPEQASNGEAALDEALLISGLAAAVAALAGGAPTAGRPPAP